MRFTVMHKAAYRNECTVHSNELISVQLLISNVQLLISSVQMELKVYGNGLTAL